MVVNIYEQKDMIAIKNHPWWNIEKLEIKGAWHTTAEYGLLQFTKEGDFIVRLSLCFSLALVFLSY